MEENVMLYMSDRNQLEMIKRANEYANRYGLALSDSEIQQLMQKRRECLFEQQRVEFGPGVLDKIIVAFCDSDFIYPDNYSETMEGLQEIFYLYKNESMDVLTDDELIQVMRDAFDGECQGSLEYLEGTYLEQFVREIRTNTRKVLRRYGKADEEN